MPQWLKRQLTQAFQTKDLHRIRILNDCWYLYKKIQRADTKVEHHS